jgi:hypothetical protein
MEHTASMFGLPKKSGSLPKGTKVRITNPATGKSIVATKVAEGKSNPPRHIDIKGDFKKLQEEAKRDIR